MRVYFIRAGTDGPVKIGVAENLASRLSCLQSGNHEKLKLIRALDGGRQIERRVHARFGHLHIRGEWFQFCSSMLTVTIEELPEFSKSPNYIKVAGKSPIHPVRRWLFENETTLEGLGKSVGITKKQLSKCIVGLTAPGIATMNRITQVTNGVITSNDFLPAALPANKAPRMKVHPLKRWLFEQELTLDRFGEKAGFSKSALSEWIHRKKYPSMAAMLRIREATQGAVTPADFVPAMAPTKRRRA